MDGVYEELDKVKIEMEKLREDCRIKTELSESLRKTQNEQQLKYQEAKLHIEKQAQELNAKSDEIFEVRQLYEDLKSSLQEKEVSLRHLGSVNEKLRCDYDERTQKLEGENKGLVLALDGATTTIQDLTSKICAGNAEIEGLKRLLSNTQKKCLEAERNIHASKELKHRDEMILKQEEEIRKFEDQLKWKNEQFIHLEEAHRLLQDQFRSSKVEWEKEKSALLEEMCSLQTNLDSQTRISERLQTQLTMCNQALAHEESRRKTMEVEVSELKSRFENVVLESEEAKSKIEQLTLKRDDEIARLRNSLAAKETIFKEVEYRTEHLEQDNEELRQSLKEIQETHIKNAAATSSLGKLKTKIQRLEQLHKKCSVNLQEKEAGWSAQMEKVGGVINGYMSELKAKDTHIQELQEELKDIQFLSEVKKEEISIVTMVLKSEFSAAYFKLLNEKAEMEMHNKEWEQKILLLTEQVKVKNIALHEVRADLEKKCEELAILVERVESFDLMKQQQIFMEEELERQKKMLAESSECRVCSKEQALHEKNSQMQDDKDVYEAFEKANSELAKKITEINQAKLELQQWKSTVENLKLCLEEKQAAFKQETESLLHTVREQKEKTGNLQHQIVLLESSIATKAEALEVLKRDKEHYIQIAEDKSNNIENLQNEIAFLKQVSARKEFGLTLALSDADKAFTNAVISVVEKQIEIDVLNETLEKTEDVKKLEIEGKNKIIARLEADVNALHQKLEFQEQSLFKSKQQAAELESLLQAEKSEMEKVKDQFNNKLSHLDDLVKGLEFEKRGLLEDVMKFSSNRKDLLEDFECICEQIGEHSGKDVELSEILGKILQNTEEWKESEMNLIESDRAYDSSNMIVNTLSSPLQKGVEESIVKRSPLMELNY